MSSEGHRPVAMPGALEGAQNGNPMRYMAFRHERHVDLHGSEVADMGPYRPNSVSLDETPPTDLGKEPGKYTSELTLPCPKLRRLAVSELFGVPGVSWALGAGSG